MPADSSVSASHLDCSKSASVRLTLCLCKDVFVTTCSASYCQWETGVETARLVSVYSYRNFHKRAEVIILSYHHYRNQAARELGHLLTQLDLFYVQQCVEMRFCVLWFVRSVTFC